MLNQIAARVVGLLPVKLQPYAKAVIPLVVAVVAAGGSWAATGSLDDTEIRAAAGVAFSSLLTLLFPNVSR